MHYLIARDGKQLGQFSDEEIRSGLFEGRYLATDVAWTEGMAEWKPLGEIMGQGVTRVAKPASAVSASLGAAPTHTAGLAIAALVLGILSLLTCSGVLVGAVAAIVCGHIALSRIGKSGGTLGGRGMAVSGLAMGYASIVLVPIVAILSSLSMASISKMAEKGQATKMLADGRQLMIACRLYAADRSGAYPASLDELASSGTLKQDALDRIQSFKPQNWKGEAGFDYFGAGAKDDAPGDKVILMSRSHDSKGKRVVVTNDTSSELRVPPGP